MISPLMEQEREEARSAADEGFFDPHPDGCACRECARFFADMDR